MSSRFLLLVSLIVAVGVSGSHAQESGHPVPKSPRWLTFEGDEGPGAGKHIVLIAADQEYRSEQSMPMLARLLSERHGFHCTVLFLVNAKGESDPTLPIRYQQKDIVHHIAGLEHLKRADLMILFSRLITLPDEEVAHVIEYLESGKPIIGIRTANHGFLENFPYRKNGKKVRFGDDVLGGAFRSHHGNWHRDSTRGIIVKENAGHPVLTGVEDVWGPSDVYQVHAKGKGLGADCTALLLGQPLTGRKHDDEVNEKKAALPIAWTKTWTGESGKTARVFHVTMGSARDYESEDLRRLTVNAAFWGLRLEDKIRADLNCALVGPYRPLPSGFNYAELGVKPRPPSTYDTRTRSLFNGKDLTGWHADVPAADKDSAIAPSFTIRDGHLVSLGRPNGHLLTDALHGDYRLEVEYRFTGKPGNCGVLVHASKPRALYGMFPQSIEVQMNSGHAGDFWCIQENIAVPDMAKRRRGPPEKWGGGPRDSRNIKNLTDDSEKSVGEWNRMVIECLDQRVRVRINGDLVNDGFDCTASSGRIALQAEGTEVEFRRLDLTPIGELPPLESR